MSSLLLRPVEPQDETFLFELYMSVRQEEVKSWGWTSTQIEHFLHMQWMAQQSSYKMQFPNAHRTVILYENESVGQCSVDCTSDRLHLIDISILPSFRNRGIGASLLKRLQLEATTLQVPIFLNVTLGNPAHRLYERLGFIMIGSTDMYVSMQWQPPNTTIY